MTLTEEDVGHQGRDFGIVGPLRPQPFTNTLRALVIALYAKEIPGFGQLRFSEIGLQFLSPGQRIARGLAARGRGVETEEVKVSMSPGQQRPGLRKLGIKSHRLFQRFRRVNEVNIFKTPKIERQSSQISVVSLCIICRLRRYFLFLDPGDLRLQLLGDRCRDVAFDRENVGEFSIKTLRPQMRIGRGVNQLHVHPDLIGRLLHAAFENVCYTKLLGDLRQIVRRTLEMLSGRARDDFQIGNLCQSRQDFFLYAIGKVSIVRVATEVLERQYCDALFRNGGSSSCETLGRWRRGNSALQMRMRTRAHELKDEDAPADQGQQKHCSHKPSDRY